MFCPFCHRAKALRKSKGVEFTEYDVGGSSDARAKMRERAGGRHTVPQSFIDEIGVGGTDDLAGIERAGKVQRQPGLAARMRERAESGRATSEGKAVSGEP